MRYVFTGFLVGHSKSQCGCPQWRQFLSRFLEYGNCQLVDAPSQVLQLGSLVDIVIMGSWLPIVLAIFHPSEVGTAIYPPNCQ